MINVFSNDKEKQAVSAIMGFVVGDALGVPVEFTSRAERKENPVTEMMGYGTYQQPPGTWSDDSSMVVATMEWLAETAADASPNYTLLMDKFSRWLMHGEYTPYGETFDCGISTNRAILNYGRGIKPTECGGKTEYDNGNGSLMRILPVALRLAFQGNNKADFIYDVSSLTHGHARSKAGCALYSKIVARMIAVPGEDKYQAVENSIRLFRASLQEERDAEIVMQAGHFGRLWEIQNFAALPETAIKSTGYIVDTLEVAIWCFLNTSSYKECVLRAVNLGNDTDTVSAIAGGLAGLYYGIENILQDWITLIPKKDWIMELAANLVN